MVTKNAAETFLKESQAAVKALFTKETGRQQAVYLNQIFTIPSKQMLGRTKDVQINIVQDQEIRTHSEETCLAKGDDFTTQESQNDHCPKYGLKSSISCCMNWHLLPYCQCETTASKHPNAVYHLLFQNIPFQSYQG